MSSPAVSVEALSSYGRIWIVASLFEIGSEKLIVMPFKQKIALKLIGPSEIDWI